MIAYVDARRGISGTSLLAALVDAGADADEIAASLQPLAASEGKLRAEETVVDGLRTCRVHVEEDGDRVGDGPRDIVARLAEIDLPRSVVRRAADVYGRIALAEARVHAVRPQAVRFEELATLRSVVGVAGSVLAAHLLGIDPITASPLPFGAGEVMTHHGRLPLPAPATLELLRGIPVEAQAGGGELVTPTGVALLASLATSFGEIPTMTIEGIGIGAATSAGASIVTRVVLGS
jgi:uncharacterized protein (DUF111 family)